MGPGEYGRIVYNDAWPVPMASLWDELPYNLDNDPWPRMYF